MSDGVLLAFPDFVEVRLGGGFDVEVWANEVRWKGGRRREGRCYVELFWHLRSVVPSEHAAGRGRRLTKSLQVERKQGEL
jgi:hypothetical protein